MNNDKDYDIEIVIYGLKIIIYNTITIGLIVLISYGLGDLLYSIFFLMSFCYLRIKIGGYHCKTYIGCLLSTNSLYLIFFMLSNNICYYNFILMLFIPMHLYYFYLLKDLKYNIRLDSMFYLISCILSFFIYKFFIAWLSGMFLAEMLFVANKIKMKKIG